MTAGTARTVPTVGAPDRKPRPTWPPRAGTRLLRLHAASRRVPAAIAAIAACAIGLRIALLEHWDTYGALQLPLVFEAGAAAAIAVTTASPIGEPERVTGRWLPFLRLATTLALTAAAAGALTAAGIGAHLAGGALDVPRNLAGMTGIGLLCRRAGWPSALGRARGLPGGGRLRAAGPVAPSSTDHTLDLAGPATTRPRRRDLRRTRVHHRHRGNQRARSPRPAGE